MSKEQGVPAYIVMHDTSLEDLCRRRPTSLAELLGVSGFGERKTELYGQSILDALARFAKGERAAPLPEKKTRPAEDTLRLLAEGRTFEKLPGFAAGNWEAWLAWWPIWWKKANWSFRAPGSRATNNKVSRVLAPVSAYSG